MRLRCRNKSSTLRSVLEACRSPRDWTRLCNQGSPLSERTIKLAYFPRCEEAIGLARKTPPQVVCPNCGASVVLDGAVMKNLEEQWRTQARPSLLRELKPEIDQRARQKAEQMVARQLREKDEELREKDKTVASLRRDVTRLQRRMPAGRAQELGVVRQETLAENLRSLFPWDRIDEVKRGVRGADVIQSVCENSRTPAGSILWETKRAAAWSNNWIAKLHSDQKRGGHSLGVIVSDVLPEDGKTFMELGGVWACTIDVAPDLAAVLRQVVLRTTRARGAASRRDDLKGQIYNYVTSPVFAGYIRSIVDTTMRIRQGVDAERRAFEVKWAERDRLVESIFADLAAIYGDLRGIDASVTMVDNLELMEAEPLELDVAPELDR